MNSNLLPSPDADTTSREPPAARQIYLLMYKPRPLPDGFNLRLSLSADLKCGLNNLLISYLLMPMPVSFTLTNIAKFSASISTSSDVILTVEFVSENLIAFDNRLSNTYWKRC